MQETNQWATDCSLSLCDGPWQKKKNSVGPFSALAHRENARYARLPVQPCLSGYKINWSKSALMPINNVKVNSSIPSFIPIKESFIYLGITIYKNIHKIARDNFNNILVKVKNDIQRWKNLKVSLQGRISTVKMNLLPRFNFFSLYATTFSPSRLL